MSMISEVWVRFVDFQSLTSSRSWCVSVANARSSSRLGQSKTDGGSWAFYLYYSALW